MLPAAVADVAAAVAAAAVVVVAEVTALEVLTVDVVDFLNISNNVFCFLGTIGVVDAEVVGTLLLLAVVFTLEPPATRGDDFKVSSCFL